MSLPTIVRWRLHSARIIRRYGSSKATTINSHRFLPSSKMRALIALYHQAESFITPENLSERIDAAFVPQQANYGPLRQLVNVRDLENALTAQRAAPKLSEWDLENVVTAYAEQEEAGWSMIKATREKKVIEALYGVDATQRGRMLPGLEVLKESAELLQETVDEDQENEREALRDLGR